MDPTFKNGDYLIVDQLTSRFEDLSRGQVVIFKYPLDPSRSFIKRVIGLPGETIDIESGVVRVKNESHPEGLALSEPYVIYEKGGALHTTLSSDEYFVMGDNRAGSLDSRSWGPLNKKFIIGHPVLRLLPVSEIGAFPGDHTTYEETQKK
jgi:signal peptidase I